MESLSTAYIAIGSNLGDKQQNCVRGIGALEQTPGIELTGRGRFYRTAPVDYMDQDWFVNSAVRIVTRLSPEDLLRRLKQIEQEMGRRTGGIRFGPRVLDLDIIFYDDLVLDDERLQLPHPRMHKRRFVLRPICDINPSVVHPVLNKTVAALLGAVDDPEQEIEPL